MPFYAGTPARGCQDFVRCRHGRWTGKQLRRSQIALRVGPLRGAKCASDECCHGHVGGKAGGESTGVVDLLAVRKDHGTPMAGTKRGDALQIILIQVKGGSAAMSTTEDGMRLRAVAKRLHARHILLATWRKRSAARFFSYRPRRTKAQGTLDLAWYREAGLGGNGRGCQVAEVWLIKK